MDELKKIAYAVVVWDNFVQEILPEERRYSDYCQSAGYLSEDLRADLENENGWPREEAFDVVRWKILSMSSPESLVKYIQNNVRYALWNFMNTLEGRSGTIEFRGGRHLRGKFRTKRWISSNPEFRWPLD